MLFFTFTSKSNLQPTSSVGFLLTIRCVAGGNGSYCLLSQGLYCIILNLLNCVLKSGFILLHWLENHEQWQCNWYFLFKYAVLCVLAVFVVVCSLNHRIIGVGKDLWRLSSPNSLPEQAHAEQEFKCFEHRYPRAYIIL